MLNSTDPADRRKIRLIEDYAKCRHLKNDLERGFAAAISLSEASSSLVYPLPPCYTIFTDIYFYLFTLGRGGVLNQRAEERVNRGEYRTQCWVENTNITYCTQESL
jgi:hypothetical protein